MDFNLPSDLVAYLAELDDFIAKEIKPLEEQDDNIRFFCLLYTSPSPRDRQKSRMPSSA